MSSSDPFIGTTRPNRPTRHDVLARGADDPVTSQIAVVTELEGHVQVRDEGGVRVLSIDGALDHWLGERSAAHLSTVLDGARALVLDLERATLLDEGAVRELLAVLLAADEVSCAVAASRLSGRMLLDRWGLGQEVAVFGTVADALQARAFETGGYGSGWSVGA